MKIGIIISRIGGEDGVALETEKWIEVFQRMGHEVFISAGKFEKDILVDKKYCKEIKSLFFGSGANEKERKRIFNSSLEDSKKILSEIDSEAEKIFEKLNEWIKENNLEVLVLENTNALPVHLPLAKAIKKIVKKTDIKIISHGHDFYWEREGKYVSESEEINNLVKELFPLNFPNVTHVVINSPSLKKLKDDFGMKAVYIPNVIDFEKPFGLKIEKNKDLPEKIGLKKDDIALFQVTRIIRRKGIETALSLIKELDDKRVKLVITGTAKDDPGNLYYNELKETIKKFKIKSQVIFAGDKFSSRYFFANYFYFDFLKNRYKTYTISDAYANAIACTFFSKYEGFGNAFVEAIAAKKPIFVNDYEPSFWEDIGSKGFKVVMIKKGFLTKKAIREIKRIIHNEKLSQRIGEFNFELGKKYFSYEVLEKKLKEILES